MSQVSEKLASKKSAPSLIIGVDMMGGGRESVIADLDDKHPEYIHAFQSEEMAGRAGELERRAQEVVMKDGRPMKVGADIVVRIPRDRYEATRRHYEDNSFNGIRGIAERSDEVRQKPTAKSPAPRKEQT